MKDSGAQSKTKSSILHNTPEQLDSFTNQQFTIKEEPVSPSNLAQKRALNP